MQTIQALGITTDSKLNFDERIFELCRKVNKKGVHPQDFGTILTIHKLNSPVQITVLANFNDCPLT